MLDLALLAFSIESLIDTRVAIHSKSWIFNYIYD